MERVSSAGVPVASPLPPAATWVRPRRDSHARRLVATLLWGVVLVNGGVAVWLWLRGGGLTAAHNGADRLTSAGRITGMLGGYLALVQVLLLARLPALERLVGFDRLTVWHRRNGKVCLYLVLAHVVLITIGYQQADKIRLGAEISSLWHDYPGMITATVGTGLMIFVVVTSLVIVRRAMPYEAWHAVHLLAYAGIALAWSHQVPTGNELSTAHTAAGWWRDLYIVTLALIVAFRFVRPVARALWFRMRVAEVREEAPGVVSLRITGRRLDRLRAQAGQFFLWHFLTPGRALQGHPFSLSAPATATELRITVKAVGGFTRRLAELRPGTRVLAEGPFGVFTQSARRRERVLLIAGGIGITPVRALAEEIGANALVIYRALREEDLVLRDELDALSREYGTTVEYVVGDHAAPGGDRLLDAEHLRALVPDIAEREVYLCGPPAMARAIERSVRKAQVPRRQIHVERFAL
ncbi:MAG: oxidoreductase FAD/NAD(P)-binding domain protein [Solirubrobacterales bacterium]|jgi:predicted ferric reductase|nr:oxidoreductase FAD/NAD(P)-binding domain protein [Solirubrobacterales bacterium]